MKGGKECEPVLFKLQYTTVSEKIRENKHIHLIVTWNTKYCSSVVLYSLLLETYE